MLLQQLDAVDKIKIITQKIFSRGYYILLLF